jgi:hypothetical protein
LTEHIKYSRTAAATCIFVVMVSFFSFLLLLFTTTS